MKKHSFRSFASLALAAGMAFAVPQQAMAGYGKIYIIGNDGSWLPPTPEYADAFADKILEETSPDVYEGTFTINEYGTYFRFYTTLLNPEYDSWRSNTVCSGLDGLWFEDLGSGVFRTSTVYDMKLLPPAKEPGTWRLEEGKYHFTVNLAEKTITAVETAATVIVPAGDNRTPSPETAGEFARLDKGRYMPAGENSFRLYDLFAGKWVNPLSGSETITETSTVDYELSDTRGAAFTLANWGGGVVTGFAWNSGTRPGTYTVQPEPDTYAHNESPRTASDLRLVGDCCVWDISEAIRGEMIGDNPALWRVVIPAGTTNFKFVDGDSWDVNYGCAYTRKNADGGAVWYLSSNSNNSDNFSFTAPLSAPLTITVDLENMLINLPAGTPVKANVDYPELGDVMYVLRDSDTVLPRKGMSGKMQNRFTCLYPDGEGNYRGTVTWGGSMKFVSELAADPADNKVIAPAGGEDYVLIPSEGQAYARGAVCRGADAASYVIGRSAGRGVSGTPVEVVVTPGEEPVVHFTFKSQVPPAGNPIYLIGSPTGWSNSSDAYPLDYTTTGVYYGHYYFGADAAGTDGALQFRFAKELGTWSSTAFVGSYPEDFFEEHINTEYEGYLYNNGMGNWVIDGWAGGELYMLVDINNLRVRFSQSPIDGVGEPVDPSTIKPFAEGLYEVYKMENNYEDGTPTMAYKEVEKLSAGVYRGSNVAGGMLELRTRQLPISPKEPEWAGSWTISALNSDDAEYDELGVLEIPFENRNYIGTEAPEPFKTGRDNVLVEYLVDMNTSKAYFAKQAYRLYIGGELTGNPAPDYSKREALKKFSVPYGGGVFDMPAGDVKFVLSRCISEIGDTRLNIEDKNYGPLVFDLADSAATPRGWIETFLNRDFTIKNWRGGKVFMAPNGIYDLAKLTEVHSRIADDVFVYQRESADGLVFTADIPYSCSQSSNPWVNISMMIQDKEVFLGSGHMINGGHLYDESAVTPESGKLQLSVYGSSFFFPSLVGEGTLKVRVDLNDMSVTFGFEEALSGNVYEVVAENNPDIDGATAYPSSEQEDAVTVEMRVSGENENGYEFNLTTAGGEVLTPATGEEEINFGTDGVWTGSFTTSAPVRSCSARAVARAASTGKWHFNLPENATGTVMLLVDEKAGKITAYSSDCNQDYFIVNAVDGNYSVRPVIENIGKLPRLVRGTDGKYTGSFEMPEIVFGEYGSVSFPNSLGDYRTGISSVGYYYGNVDFFMAPSVEYPAIGRNVFGESSAYSFQLYGPADEVAVVFDPEECLITFTAVNSGVENVDAEADMTVRGSVGHIEVETARAANLCIFNMQGMLVKQLEVPAGVSRIELPAALYIVNSNKVLVK